MDNKEWMGTNIRTRSYYLIDRYKYKCISTCNKTTDELFNDVSQWIAKLTNETFAWWCVEVLHMQ